MIYFSFVVLSFNLPKFDQCASWSSNAITFPNTNSLNAHTTGLFIDANNTVYVTSSSSALKQLKIWFENGDISTRTITGNWQIPKRPFVTTNGDIYVDNSEMNHRIDKWTVNETNSVVAMFVPHTCDGLFVDIQNTIYCSIGDYHKVIKKSVDSSANESTVVAGTGVSGQESNMLYFPKGIFVDISLNLYVADRSNSRIQLFKYGQLNATTVAGKGSNMNFKLIGPRFILVDADRNIFIIDSSEDRIVVVGPIGCRCLVACTGTFGSKPNELKSPSALAFDTYGNMFIADGSNKRVQKFLLVTNSCGKSNCV